MLYAFFWAIPRRLNFMCQSFGTLFYNFIGGVSPTKMEQTACSENLAQKFRRREIAQKKTYIDHYVGFFSWRFNPRWGLYFTAL